MLLLRNLTHTHVGVSRVQSFLELSDSIPMALRVLGS